MVWFSRHQAAIQRVPKYRALLADAHAPNETFAEPTAISFSLAVSLKMRSSIAGGRTVTKSSYKDSPE
jgi:hypothetical protein